MSNTIETITVASLHSVVGGQAVTGTATFTNATQNNNSTGTATTNTNSSAITNPACPDGFTPQITNQSSGSNYLWGAYSTTSNSTDARCVANPTQPTLTSPTGAQSTDGQ